jgi:hypothetical protein
MSRQFLPGVSAGPHRHELLDPRHRVSPHTFITRSSTWLPLDLIGEPVAEVIDDRIDLGGSTCLPQPVQTQLDQHQSPSSIVSRQMRVLREPSIQSE